MKRDSKKSESSQLIMKLFRDEIGSSSPINPEDTKLEEEKKNEKFKQLLSCSNIDLESLKKLCWSGIPDSYRCEVWKLLLGYSHPKSKRRNKIIKRKRKEYQVYVKKYCEKETGESDSKTEFERKQRFQISIDVPRTLVEYKFFKREKIQNSFKRILSVWALRHPVCGYVQGMNDLLSLFYYTYYLDAFNEEDVEINEEKLLEIEADSYWSFSILVEKIQDNFTFGQPGIKRKIQKLEEITKRMDQDLHQHFIKSGLNFMQLFFKWMNCFLIREFSLKLIKRLFDTYLAEGNNFEELHIFICAALLKRWSDELKKKDTGELIMYLQKPPTANWNYSDIDTLLSQSYILMNWYGNK